MNYSVNCCDVGGIGGNKLVFVPAFDRIRAVNAGYVLAFRGCEPNNTFAIGRSPFLGLAM